MLRDADGKPAGEATSRAQINWRRVKKLYFEVYLFRSALTANAVSAVRRTTVIITALQLRLGRFRACRAKLSEEWGGELPRVWQQEVAREHVRHGMFFLLQILPRWPLPLCDDERRSRCWRRRGAKPARRSTTTCASRSCARTPAHAQPRRAAGTPTKA